MAWFDTLASIGEGLGQSSEQGLRLLLQRKAEQEQKQKQMREQILGVLPYYTEDQALPSDLTTHIEHDPVLEAFTTVREGQRFRRLTPAERTAALERERASFAERLARHPKTPLSPADIANAQKLGLEHLLGTGPDGATVYAMTPSEQTAVAQLTEQDRLRTAQDALRVARSSPQWRQRPLAERERMTREAGEQLAFTDISPAEANTLAQSDPELASRLLIAYANRPADKPESTGLTPNQRAEIVLKLLQERQTALTDAKMKARATGKGEDVTKIESDIEMLQQTLRQMARPETPALPETPLRYGLVK
jgi:hypothetical protein